MFDFSLDEDVGLMRDAAAAFASRRLAPAMRQFEAQRSVHDVREEMAALGLDRFDLPAGFGGLGLGAQARVLINEELGAADAGAAVALDGGRALAVIACFADDEATGALAEQLTNQGGRRAVVVVVDDDVMRDVSQPISLRVPWVPADKVDVVALLDRSGACVIEDGFHLSRLPGAGLRAAGACEINIDNAWPRLRWSNGAAARRALATLRLFSASLILGALRSACDISREYAKERVAFGRPIAHHQAMAFLIVDMAIALEGARLIVSEAAMLLDSGADATGAAAHALVEAQEISSFIAPNAIQILGGSGYMQDYPLEKIMRETSILTLIAGGVDRARDDAGRCLLTLRAEPWS